MKLLLAFSLLFTQSSPCLRPDSPSVRISVISQTRFNNRGHYPWHDRKVVFRLMNVSARPVIVYGFADEDELYPGGYMMVFNRRSRNWEYPNPDNQPTPWAEVSSLEKSKRILRPGETISFVAEMSRFEVGSRFRRTAYVSFNENEVPCEIRGRPFILR
jgi:hypothetical protein